MRVCKICQIEFEVGHGKMCRVCHSQKSLNYYYQTYEKGSCVRCGGELMVHKIDRQCRLCRVIRTPDEVVEHVGS